MLMHSLGGECEAIMLVKQGRCLIEIEDDKSPPMRRRLNELFELSRLQYSIRSGK